MTRIYCPDCDEELILLPTDKGDELRCPGCDYAERVLTEDEVSELSWMLSYGRV